MEFNGFKPDMGSTRFYLEACQYQHSMDHLEFVSSINGLKTSFCNILNASSIQRNFSEINGCSSTGMENIIDQTSSSSGLLGVNSMTTSEAGTTPIATHQYHHGMQFDGNWPLGVEKPLTTYGQKPISGNTFFQNVLKMNKRCTSTKKHGTKKKGNVIKGQWTVEEDRSLIRLVEQFGLRRWSYIAQRLNGRIGKQCRERWHNHLRPNIKKDNWSEEEDRILIQSHTEIGNRWAEIAKRLVGRTENSIKNHWNATKRRQFSRRRCRNPKNHYPSTLLQNYIQSLNLVDYAQVESSNSTTGFTPTLPVKKELEVESSRSDFVMVPDYELDESIPEFMLDDHHCRYGSVFEDIQWDVNDNQDDEYYVGGGASAAATPVVSEMDAEDQMMALPKYENNVQGEIDLMEMISQTKIANGCSICRQLDSQHISCFKAKKYHGSIPPQRVASTPMISVDNQPIVYPVAILRIQPGSMRQRSRRHFLASTLRSRSFLKEREMMHGRN